MEDKQKPNRYIRKEIKLSPEEWKIIRKRAAALGQSTGTYIRRISVQGIIKTFDMKQFNHLIMSFNRIGNEVNQIARVANSTKSVYAKDIEDLKKSFDELQIVFANYLLPIKSLDIVND